MGMTEKSRKHLRKFAILLLGMAVMCLAGCSSSSKSPAEPYVVKIGDMEVKTGETTLQELADAGYEISDSNGREMMYDDEGNLEMLYTQVYDLTSETEARTVYSAIAVVKDLQQVAIISICNDAEENAPLSECKVTTVTIYSNYWEMEKASFEGVSMENMSSDALTEVLGEPTRVSESQDKYTWERGLYTLELNYQEDGSVDNVRSSFNAFAS